MNLGGALSGVGALSNVYPGYVQGEQNQANATIAQQAAEQAKMQTQSLDADIQSNVGYANSLAALAQATATPPPTPPPTVAPGQASQPTPPPAASPTPQAAPPPGQVMPGQGPPPGPPQPSPLATTSGGNPIAPPGAPLGSAPQQPQAQPSGASTASRPAPAPPQARPATGLPAPQGQGGPPAPAGGQQSKPTPQQAAQAAEQVVQKVEAKAGPATVGAEGTMSMQQLVQLVQKANPGLAQKNPQAFVRVVEKMQKFLSQDGKQELAQKKAQLDYDAKIQKINSDADNAVRKAESAEQVANIRAAQAEFDAKLRAGSADARTQEMFQAVLAQILGRKDVAAATDQTKKDVQAEKDTSAEKRNAETVQGAQKRTDTQVAGRKDIAADAAKVKAANAPTPLTAEGIANAGTMYRHTGKMPAMGMSAAAGDRQKIINWAADTKNKDDPAAIAQLSGQMGLHAAQQGANVIARIEAQVQTGAAELPDTLKQITPLVKKLNTSQVPNLNALKQWGLAHTGDPNVPALNNYLAQVQAAAQLIRSRGGQVTDKVRNAASQVIDGSMPLNQIVSAGGSLITEADIVRKATSSAMQETIKAGIGGSEEETPAPETGTQKPAQAGSDVESILKNEGLPYEPGKFDYRVAPDGSVQSKPKREQ